MKHIRIIFAVTMGLVVLGSGNLNAKSVGTRTDALDDSAWNSSVWISAADAPVVTGAVVKDKRRAADGASWFLSTVKNDKKVVSAKWMVSGLGVFQIFLNGKPVGEEILRPGFTHREKTRLSFTYDCTSGFNKAEGALNTLSAQVTPGWWADKIVTPNGHDGMIGHKCAFRCVLQLTFEDGTTKLVGTDTANWKAGIAGPVKHAGIFDGEEYDARVKPGFETPGLLGTPEVNKEFPGRIFPSDGAEVYLRRDLAIKPVKAYVWKDIEGAGNDEYGKIVVKKQFKPGSEMTVLPGENLVIDFGQNAAAVPSFVFKAAEGTVLTCLPSEILNDGNGAKSRGMDGPEGSCHRTNLRLHDLCFKAEYTFGGNKGYVNYTPSCTFFGYRYVTITATSKVSIKSIESVPVTSIGKHLDSGVISTGDESINRLISNTVWGQRSNYLSVPTDCPQRDERLGWTADTQVFTETGTFFANTDRFFHKWMRDMRDSQSKTGAYPGVAPVAQYGGDYMRLGWADAGIIVPWTIWKQFNDTSIIDENWDSMELFLNHVTDTKYDQTANMDENKNYQWADWLSYEPMESWSGAAFIRDVNGKTIRDAKNRKVPMPEAVEYWNFLSGCYWAMDAAMMADMAAASGRDEAKYRAVADEARTYLKARFLKSNGKFLIDILNTMQTPALFALKLNLVEGAAKDDMCKRLRANFAEHDGCLQTGFLGTSILMSTLTENGMADIAWDLLFQRKNPSWLYSVDNGATTIWERWNSYTFESGMAPKGMNSFNHYAYGAVCQWIWETAAGIATDPSAPGFKRIIMSPVPDRRLGSLKAEYKSAAGTIRSEWAFDGDVWNWKFTVPEGAKAIVTLPGENEAKEYIGGTYSVSKKL